MEIKELAKNVKKWFYKYDITKKGRGHFIEKGLIEMSKSKDYNLGKKKVKHYTYIDAKNLFCDIDTAIECLYSLKEQGFTEIEENDSLYGDNFIASKVEDEYDCEFYKRLAQEAAPFVKEYIDSQESTEKREKRIKELEKELKLLKSKV